MELNQYETVFILTPVLSDEQMKDAVEKFRNVLKKNEVEFVGDENWGLKKLAYPILHKNTGFFHLFEFKANPTVIAALELEFRRDEKVLRFMTVKLDKHSIEFNARRRNGEFNKKSEDKKEGTAA
ncbi:MAG: 30S ribosomal protein S6 [Cyclobacteriaceae bacterium]|nr:30S ribosomal protein S6 [Cyclobacteriaceae bacterium]MCH8516520.1 30S ribosomal protein S6 [Cyclobacteriaceae bacterium]